MEYKERESNGDTTDEALSSQSFTQDQADDTTIVKIDLSSDADEVVENDLLSSANNNNNNPDTPQHDLLSLENATVKGLGVGAQFVNSNAVQWNITSPFWAILPATLAPIMLTNAVLENKSKKWKETHASASKGFSGVSLGVELVGVWSFNESMLMQYWPGVRPENIRTVTARCAIPFAAIGMSIPFTLLVLIKQKSLAKNPKTPKKIRECMGHKATKKIANVIATGLIANSSMGAILLLAQGFHKLGSQNAIIISGSYAGASLLIECLPKKRHCSIDWVRWSAERAHDVVNAGSLGSATISLAFAVASGITHDDIPDPVAPVVGAVIAVIVIPALAYRLWTKAKLAKENNAKANQELVDVAEREDESDAVVTPLVSRNRHFLFSSCCQRQKKGEKQHLLDNPRVAAEHALSIQHHNSEDTDTPPAKENSNPSQGHCQIL